MQMPGIDQVKNAMSRMKYVVCDGIDKDGNRKNLDLNIFGVRSSSAVPDSFDDLIGVFWMNWAINDWEYHVWPATTDPGLYFLNHPLRIEGTAILKEGQHRSSHVIGVHRGKYKALVQHSSLPVYRDRDRDDVIDINPANLHVGYFGINIHRTAAYQPHVGKNSAGCQVIAEPRDFAVLMDICFDSDEIWGPVFSYTLLTEEQLRFGERSINDLGLKLVKECEGCKLEAYICPAGVLTIGYGHTRDVRPHQRVTIDQAEDLLDKDLAESATYVNSLVRVPLSDNQFAALVSFVFNVGRGNFSGSTLLKKLNGGDYDSVPYELARWNKATDPKTGEKRELPGLTRRRAAEGALWLTPADPSAFENTADMPQLVAAPE